MQCQTCFETVTEKDCTYGGLHFTGECFGRVYMEDGSEFIGGLRYFGNLKKFMNKMETERESNARCEWCE